MSSVQGYKQNADSTRETFRRYSEAVRTNCADTHLKSLVQHYGRASTIPDLERFGRVCATTLDTLARATNQMGMLPRLQDWDGFGNYTGEVWFPAETKKLRSITYAANGGLLQKMQQPGGGFVLLSHFYLFAQNAEAGHGCPLTCNVGVIKILRNEPVSPLVSEWITRLEDPNYATHYQAAEFLTEVQGGSDVGANTLRAVPVEDDLAYEGWHRLHGEKWFCSVCNADLFMIVARPDGVPPKTTRGLRVYIAPRHLPYGDKRVNAFRIRRLKHKLGTSSMASGEIDFHGMLALPLQCKFTEVLDIVVNTSRLYNAMSSAGGMHRSFMEASSYAHNRVAFDRRIIEFPMIANTVAMMRAESYGGRAVCFFLADMQDRMKELKLSEKLMWRIIINMNKIWAAETAEKVTHSAIDTFGGNGAIEDFSILPRLLRDGVVGQQWEGPTNTLTSQIFRDCKKYKMHVHFFNFLRQMDKAFPAPVPAAAELEEEWTVLLGMPDDEGLRHFKHAIFSAAPVLQYYLLMKESDAHDPMVTTAATHVLLNNQPTYKPRLDKDFVKRVNFLANISTAAGHKL